MARENIQDKRFSFLHSHIAREPHIYEVLNEIMNFQNDVLRTGIGNFATLDDLKTSRNIKIPFTFMRNKTITNLVDILTKNYPDQLKTLITFYFSVQPETKKLSITEKRELTVLLSNEEFSRIQTEKNQQSAENFLNLISQFRLFNLTKLIKKAKERTLLSQIIKTQVGISIFTFKNFIINKQNSEIIDDFCFYKENYNVVRKTINVDKIRSIITNHSIPINRRLKKFGILNTEFSDYKDTKLDYLLNILLEDIASTLSITELTDVKNFNSLRACLIKVETVIDPLISAGNDIVAYIKENQISSIGTVTSIFSELEENKLLKWAGDHAREHKILIYKDEDNITYLIDGENLLPKFSELHNKILYHHEQLEDLSHIEKEKLFDEFTILCNTAKNLLKSGDIIKSILTKEEDIKKLNQLIEEYEGYQKSISIDTAMAKEDRNVRKRRSILSVISNFLLSLFTFEKNSEVLQVPREDHNYFSTSSARTVISKEAKSIIYRIKNSQEKIIPLSNYIELLPVNESNIETIINDIRRLNLKIVVPIYNARKILYPVRSQQYLIPDIEYLLVPPDILQSPESIRNYIDSIAGEKAKDEKIPASAILSIEKYLMRVHNQKKIQMRRKGK